MSFEDALRAATEPCESCGRVMLDCHNRPCVGSMAGLFAGGPDSVEWLREQRS